MMGPYLNKHETKHLTFFLGIHGYLESLLEEDHERLRPYRKRIKTMMTYCQSVVHLMLEGMDLAQVETLRKKTSHYTLVIEPDEKVKGLKELMTLETRTVDLLRSNSFNECFMCEKVMGAARDCELRRALLDAEAPIEDHGKGICPFKHGVL